MLRTTTTCTFSTAQLPKVLQEWCAFTILTSKRASCHNDVDISTSKSAPNLTVFHSFEFEMCFLPQWRALFNSSTSKSAPRMVCFYHFWISNVLPATTMSNVHHFRHLNFQKRSKSDNSLTVLTSKCASCHNGVHVFNSATSESATRMVCLHHFDFQMCFPPQQRALFRHLNPKELRTWQFFNRFDFEICFAPQQRALFQQLNFQKWCKNGVFFNILTSNCASKCAFAEPGSFPQFWFRNVATRRFGEPTFRSFRAPKHWENKVFRDFSSFLRSCIFFLLTFSLFSASFFCLSLTALFPPLLFICLHCRKSEF